VGFTPHRRSRPGRRIAGAGPFRGYDAPFSAIQGPGASYGDGEPNGGDYEEDWVVVVAGDRRRRLVYDGELRIGVRVRHSTRFQVLREASDMRM
jgi:hypothetical protein